MSKELELMDWKDIESGAETTIRESSKNIAIANILLKSAQKQIKKLGGKTNEEVDNEIKEKIQSATK